MENIIYSDEYFLQYVLILDLISLLVFSFFYQLDLIIIIYAILVT